MPRIVIDRYGPQFVASAYIYDCEVCKHNWILAKIPGRPSFDFNRIHPDFECLRRPVVPRNSTYVGLSIGRLAEGRNGCHQQGDLHQLHGLPAHGAVSLLADHRSQTLIFRRIERLAAGSSTGCSPGLEIHCFCYGLDVTVCKSNIGTAGMAAPGAPGPLSNPVSV